jgi:hypothetical protein
MSKKKKPDFPKKLKIMVNGKKTIFNKSNPKMFLATVAIFAVLALLVYCVIVYMDDFTLMFAVAIVAVLFPWAVQIYSMINEEHHRAISYCARIESIKLDKRKFVATLKNIGTSNIFDATILYIRSDGQFIAQNILINFLPANDTMTLIYNHKLKLDSTKKFEYVILLSSSNILVVLSYEQRMELIDGEYVIENNTCELRRRLYYKCSI